MKAGKKEIFCRHWKKELKKKDEGRAVREAAGTKWVLLDSPGGLLIRVSSFLLLLLLLLPFPSPLPISSGFEDLW